MILESTPPQEPAPPAQEPQEPSLAPVATPAPAAPVAPVLPPPEAPPAVGFAKTGDPALDVALDFFAKAGIDPDDAALESAKNGDFLLLKAKLAQQGDKARGFENFVALAEAAYTKRMAQEAQHAQAVVAAATQAVGGQETWGAIKAWAATTLPEAELAALNSAFLNSNPTVATLLGQGLLSRYRAEGGTVEGRPVVTPGARTVTAPQGALSADEYAAQVRALAAKTRGNPEASPEYQALRNRRALGIKQGI